jgi:multidrug efflux system membrane fusion protein
MLRYLSTSTISAIVLTVAVAVWMLSGTRMTGNSVTAPRAGDTTMTAAVTRGKSPESASESSATPRGERSLMRVSTVKSLAQSVVNEVTVSARTEPNRSVEIRAEAEGRIVELNAERGALIREGAQIARIDMRDLEARLAEASARIDQHRLEFEAAERLVSQALLSEVQIAEARAQLVASEAALANIELEIEHTRVYAPFEAVVQEREIEIGDFVQVGDTIADLVDTNPLIVVGAVSEQEVGALTVGSPGSAEIIGGQSVEGTIRYISPVADQATRTFQVELAVPNSGNRLRAGMTAELRLAGDEIVGHLLSPGLLTLDDTGTIGVKSVDAENRVRFVPVEILRSTSEGVWVSGLPQTTRIIAVGQGFVTDGEPVEPVDMASGYPGAR